MKNWMLIVAAGFALWYVFMRKKKATVNNPVPSTAPLTKEAEIAALLAKDAGVS